MKKFLATVLLLSSMTFSANSNAGLVLGLTGNPLILAPMVPALLLTAGTGGGNSFLGGLAVFGGSFLGFFLLNETGTVSVISESDSVESLVAEGMSQADAELLDSNREEINAAVNAVFATLDEKSTREEVAMKWAEQKDFIGGEEVLNAYNLLGNLRVLKNK